MAPTYIFFTHFKFSQYGRRILLLEVKMSNKSVYILASTSTSAFAVRSKDFRHGTGFSKGGSVSSSLGQRSHRNSGFVAGCHDRRATSRLHEDDPLVVWSGPAAAAIATDDHDDDEKNRATNHSSLAAIVHLMPPCKDTLIKKYLHEEYLTKDIHINISRHFVMQIITMKIKGC